MKELETRKTFQKLCCQGNILSPIPFNSKYSILISSAPKRGKYDLMCLWQVYAFLNQVLLKRFEKFSLIADCSHLYELLFISLEPWQQTFNHYSVCLDSLHLFANFHLIPAHNTRITAFLNA